MPGYLDTIASRILGLRRGAEPMDTPEEIAEALSSVPRPAPASVSTVPPSVELRSEPVDTMGSRSAMPPIIHRPAPPRRSPMLSRFVLTVVVLLAMVVVGVGAWTLGKSLGTEPAVPSASPSTPAEEGQAAGKPTEVKIAGATGFDPLGDGEERNELAALAIDGSATTDWHTETYGGPDFGRLKEGVGLLLDLGKETRLTQAVIDFGESGGTVELRTGTSPEPDSLKTFLTRKDVSGKVTFDLNGSSPTRYLLVWFTELPPHGQGYRTMIRDVKLMAAKDRPGRFDLVYALCRSQREVWWHHRAREPLGIGRPVTSPPDFPQPADPSGQPVLSDADLLTRHIGGDTTAFSEIVKRHRDRMWAVALRTLGDPDEAADAVQDAFVSAYRKAESFRGDAAVTTWLHRIVVNACLDRMRRKSVRPVADDELIEAAERDMPLPDQTAEREVSLEVTAALKLLPTDQRAALVLVDMMGYSVEDAAAVLDVPIRNGEESMCAGRAKLAPILSHLRNRSDLTRVSSPKGAELRDG